MYESARGGARGFGGLAAAAEARKKGAGIEAEKAEGEGVEANTIKIERYNVETQERLRHPSSR